MYILSFGFLCVFISISRQSLNVDITSSTFTDVNFRYAAGRDGISASVSTPSTGFLGLQFNTRLPSQMSARIYSRYAVSIKAIFSTFFVVSVTPFFCCHVHPFCWTRDPGEIDEFWTLCTYTDH